MKKILFKFVFIFIFCLVKANKEIINDELLSKHDDEKKLENSKRISESKSTKITEVHNGTLVSVHDCLFFYQRGGSIIYKPQKENKTIETFKYEFHHKPTDINGICIKDNNEKSTLSLKFKLLNMTSSKNNIKLNFTVVKNKKGFWKIINLSVKLYHFDKKFKYETKETETPLNFSYSCKDFSIITNNLNDKLSLKLNNFQVQAFYSKKIFTDSFDCSPLFTLGSWMGLIVIWFFTIIIIIGSYALMNIRTMDRFDNTKGKTINVPSSDQ